MVLSHSHEWREVRRRWQSRARTIREHHLNAQRHVSSRGLDETRSSWQKKALSDALCLVTVSAQRLCCHSEQGRRSCGGSCGHTRTRRMHAALGTIIYSHSARYRHARLSLAVLRHSCWDDVKVLKAGTDVWPRRDSANDGDCQGATNADNFLRSTAVARNDRRRTRTAHASNFLRKACGLAPVQLLDTAVGMKRIRLRGDRQRINSP